MLTHSRWALEWKGKNLWWVQRAEFEVSHFHVTFAYLSNCLRPSRHRAHWYYWSTGGLQRSVTILYCVWSWVAQKWRKTRRNAGLFFAFSFLRSSACMGSKHHHNRTQKLEKRGKNGGLGWFWGLLGELLEAFGPQHGPKLKKVSPSTPSQGPPGRP